MASEACVKDNAADFARLDQQMRDVQQQIVLGPVVNTQAALILEMHSELKHEKHLRHQTDGRYRSEVSEANQAMKREATMFKDDRDRLLIQCDMKDGVIVERDRMMVRKDEALLEAHRFMMTFMEREYKLIDRVLRRERSPSPVRKNMYGV